MTTKVPVQHPLFLRYDVSVIARRMGRNESYVGRIKAGYDPLTRKFRRDAAREFRKPESELFLPEETHGSS